MKRIKKLIISILMMLLCVNSFMAYGADNADTGSGDTGKAERDKGYYNKSEYMYKVSVYVGVSDTADTKSSLNTNWKMIGSNPLYVRTSSFSPKSNALYGNKNKVTYQKKQSISVDYNPYIIVDNPPPPPITSGGNIASVKSYFGDTSSLNSFIDAFASQQGKSRETLVENITFTIAGETKRFPANEILPIKVDGQYQNKVPWLIVYEPVIISYLKDGVTTLAFIATEYALAQELGYFNFKGGTDGQYISAMTHSTLPNSIFLEESWFGYPVTPALADGVHWSNSRIIAGGGWGMRMLKANAMNVVENDTEYDYEYRVDTDVITSVRIHATEDITPDNRHESEEAYANPTKNTATITMSANGYSKSSEVVIPQGGSELVWLKWHTPSEPGDVNINVSISGNSAALIDGSSRSATLTGKVVDLSLSEPPNPTANDRNDTFVPLGIPIKAEKISAQWGIYSCYWIPNWVWHPKWEWEAKWEKDYYTYHHSGGCKDRDDDGEDDYCPGHRRYRWEDNGQWVDNGNWVDEGHWEYDYTNYSASLSGQMDLVPDINVPTAREDTMKSGYGVNIDIQTTPTTNAPSSHVTQVQNIITYFPEFHYESYWRVLDAIEYGNFMFSENKYSTYKSRVHFSPVWYPDGQYPVYAEVIDYWTPEGMLRINLDDHVTISGSVFDDWSIVPKQP